MHGDSSLYLKTAKKNKSSFFGDLLHNLNIDSSDMWFRANADADIAGVERSIRDGPECQIIGISLFGNGLTFGDARSASLDKDIERTRSSLQLDRNGSTFSRCLGSSPNPRIEHFGFMAT